MSEEWKIKCCASLAKGRASQGPTWLEKALANLLASAGFSFEEQVPRGVYHVDAWVPDYGLVFEADGSYWHQNPGKERARDAYLLRGGVAAVIHLSEEDLRPFEVELCRTA